MARTSTTRTTRRGGRYTDEQRAERARRDGELLDRAARTLAGDAQVIGDFVRQAVAGMSPRILSYSLRNQMLLMDQAADRGIRLTDVDTFKGWLSRGRCVRRGEQGLRIIRPVGTVDDDKNNPEPETADNHPKDEHAPIERVLFRMMVVFDLSQTDTVEQTEPETHDCPSCGAAPGEPCAPKCACPACAGTTENAEANTPGELLWNNLYEQITRAGYQFDWPADIPARVQVDHDARTVHVAMDATADDPDALADLAAAVAQILTHADAKRAARAALPATASVC